MRTIIVPNIGLSWNRKTLKEIVAVLKENNVPIQRQVQSRTFWEMMEN